MSSFTLYLLGMILVVGPPGSGKGTQTGRLASRLRIPHLSTGQMLRDARKAGTQRGEEAARYVDEGRLAPDYLVLEMVAERLAEHK